MSHSDHLLDSPKNAQRLSAAVDRANAGTTPSRQDPLKWHGMLMSGPMVLSTLADRKRHTRRVVTDRTSEGNFKASELDLDNAWVDPGLGAGAYLKSYLKPEVSKRLGHPPKDIIERLYCRVSIGDRLWIREAWAAHFIWNGVPPREILDDGKSCVFYDADGAIANGCQASQRGISRRSFHMPRWASRITLEVTDVRPERVQDIGEDDVIGEGLERGEDGYSVRAIGNTFAGPQAAFAFLWDSLNGPRGYTWDLNPLVWVISFKRVA